jgi:hypothetical protein
MAVGAALVAVLPACDPAPVTTLTRSTWCDGFESERIDPIRRMSGPNRERLEAAQRVVAPGLGRSRAISGLSLLGGYQEEMQRVRPDVTAAAIYLATASAEPVTPELVAHVNGLLCVTTTSRRAAEIAALAAASRREMIEGSRT